MAGGARKSQRSIPASEQVSDSSGGCLGGSFSGDNISELKKTIPDAAKILQRNVYGWFIRRERGHYLLTDAGNLY